MTAVKLATAAQVAALDPAGTSAAETSRAEAAEALLAPKASPALTGSPTVNGNALSGANTGDETASTIKAKLGITTLSGSNTGDQSIPTALPPNGSASGDLTGSYPSPNVAKINGTALSGLATGLLKNTTSTGVPSIAAAGTDYLAPAGNGSGLTGITESQVSGLTTDLAAKAPLASPTLTGNPTAPTQTAGDSSTKLATTAFATTGISAITAAKVGAAGVFNVKNATYGAVGDNTANDTTAIAAALTAAAAAGGGIVYLPPGTYKISSALVVPSNVILQGAGLLATTISQTSTSANGVSITSATAIQDCGVRGLTVLGPGSGTGIGILASANSGALLVTRPAISDVSVSGFGSHGVQLDDSILATVDRVFSNYNGGRGFYINAGTTFTARNCWALGNASERGWYLSAASVFTLISCGADQNAIGYEVNACTSGNFISCDAYLSLAANSLDGSSIKISGGSQAINVFGCLVSGSKAAGLYVTGSSVNVVVSAFAEISPGAGATASIKVDAGASAIVYAYDITTAVSIAGSVILLGTGYSAVPSLEVYGGLIVDTSAQLALIGLGTTVPSVNGTIASAPPTNATIQTALGNLTLGTAFHNTLSYDVVMTVYLSVTANTSGVVKLGVGTTTTPTQATLITGVTTTGFLPVTFKVPAGQYALLSISGTITDTKVGQWLEAA